MTSKRAKKRLLPGDVLELPVPGGFAYLQYTHKDRLFGTLVRVLPGIFPERPGSFDRLVASPERFATFFPSSAALARGLVTVVGRAGIPEIAQQFPRFKVAGDRDPVTGRVLNWWLWDGEREWPVQELTPEERRLPLRATVNDTLLIQRIISGWSPEDEVQQ